MSIKPTGLLFTCHCQLCWLELVGWWNYVKKRSRCMLMQSWLIRGKRKIFRRPLFKSRYKLYYGISNKNVSEHMHTCSPLIRKKPLLTTRCRQSCQELSDEGQEDCWGELAASLEKERVSQQAALNCWTKPDSCLRLPPFEKHNEISATGVRGLQKESWE